MKDIFTLCFAGIFVVLGFILILLGVASPTYGGLHFFLLGVASIVLSFRIGD